MKDNNIEKIKIFFRFLFEIYKILTSCLLIIFVPQKCENGERMCSFSENFKRLDPYNTFVLYFNISTSIVFFIYYIIELYRERIYIQLLDIKKSVTDENYKHEVRLYPKIKKKVKDINSLFYGVNIFLIVVFSINIIISLVVIIKFYINDLTIFITITNTIIILDKLMRSFFIAKKSYNEQKAYSMYIVKDVTYNTVNKKIKNLRKKRRRERIKKNLMKENEKLEIKIDEN